MLFALKLHAESKCPTVTGINVELTPSELGFALCYRILGDVSELSLPPGSGANRKDELWRHTCCEAFIGAVGTDAYYEFNFSPSSEWAAYRFDGYRKGMRPALEIATPKIAVRREKNVFELSTAIDWRTLRLTPKLKLALAAVIEGRLGGLSYWAYSHPDKHESARPDFHHPSSFKELELTL